MADIEAVGRLLSRPNNLRAVLTLFLLGTTVFPQMAPCADGFRLDDRELYSAYFRFHAHMIGIAEQQDKTDSSAARDLRQALRQRTSLSNLDFDRLTRIAADHGAGLAALDAEGRAYISDVMRRRGVPDADRLTAFETRRKRIVEKAIARLERELSPEGVAALRSHIKGEFSKGIRIAQIGGAR